MNLVTFEAAQDDGAWIDALRPLPNAAAAFNANANANAHAAVRPPAARRR